MSYCPSPSCPEPKNPDNIDNCQSCGKNLCLNNRFRLIDLIGEGGFGRTFKARDNQSPILTSFCLVKQFDPQSYSTSNARLKNYSQSNATQSLVLNASDYSYHKEVEQLAIFKHDQIPAFMASFQLDDGYCYIIQQFIEGRNLEQELSSQGAFNENQILQMLQDILPVLCYIHKNAVIHRDIKPENIIKTTAPLQNGTSFALVDFGAAKTVKKNQLHSSTTTIATQIGTPTYTSPEQSKGKAVYASDLYSLGITCIRLLTALPLDQLFDDGEHSWVWKDRCKNKVGIDLSRIIDKLLEFGKNKRYELAQDVLNDLENPSGEKSKKTEKKKRINPFEKIISIFRSPENVKATIYNKIEALSAFGNFTIALLVAAAGLGLFSLTKCSGDSTPSTPPIVKNEKEINLELLKKMLQDKKWSEADKVTYELMLGIAGELAQKRGLISFDEFKSLNSKSSCTLINKIDEAWKISSDGKFGFSIQESIYEQSGQNVEKMNERVKWKNLAREIDENTRRLKYIGDKKPDFVTPVPGHLPISVNLVHEIKFPQLIKICKGSLDEKK
jgi:serine/threonine protein kinase